MAEVMQPLLQPSGSMSMLQSRSSSNESYQGNNTPQHFQQPQRSAGQTPRIMYNHQGSYRATSTAPVQPYAFQATPHLRQETRTISASSIHSPTVTSPGHGRSTSQSQNAASPSLTGKRSLTKDELSADRPGSVISLSSSIPDLSLTNFDTAVKSSPDRYRRGPRRTDSSNASTQHQPSSTTPSGSGMSSVEHLYTPPPQPIMRTASDDVNSSKSSEAAKRYRRRSLGNLETNVGATTAGGAQNVQGQRPASSHTASRSVDHKPSSSSSTIRPVSVYQRSGSTESSKGRSGTVTPPTHSQENLSPSTSPSQQARRDGSPSRPSSRNANDAHKRMTNPSPLSRSAYNGEDQGASEQVDGQPTPKASHASSPAAQHLAALSDKDLNKGMKSRLRRAFSFGSAAELRKASGENAAPSKYPQRSKTPEELEQEQDEIAQRQEAAGIGAGIYSGQGGFTGSTDNLSISSTASSASIMLRKMGKGMKKGGRSLKGLFRPKSVIGVPAADGPVQPSLAQVSMVTVEAERQKVNVNANAADQVGGGTGFPKLERNSVDVNQSGRVSQASHERNDSMRKSIVGSEKERAEVLAAVRKGILKRNGTSSPQKSPVIAPQPHVFPETHISLSPASSLPGTPKDERQSRSLTSTNSASSNDYFSRTGGVSKSMPATPVSGRNISFSPRIQFHDVWSSTEYDRRGEISTCNRLTPILAQQIKEELNTFKMEMEVHELSKPHTHFF